MDAIVIIGSGNVATCLGKALRQGGQRIAAVYSPDAAHAKALADTLQTVHASSLAALPVASLYMLAVKDAAIAEVSEALDVTGTVVHCSGMTPMDVLQKHAHYGVLWPMQTISMNNLPDLKEAPICVEGNDEVTAKKLEHVAGIISNQVMRMDSAQRQYAHLASVFANNFANHLFGVAAQLLQDHQLPFDLLRPLIAETARKVMDADPAAVQTGPAKRHDMLTIEQHLRLLQTYPGYRQIYELLSASISKPGL